MTKLRPQKNSTPVKRSDTVEELLQQVGQELPVSYDDVFRTRNRVVDDRTPSPVAIDNNFKIPYHSPARFSNIVGSNNRNGLYNTSFDRDADLSSSIDHLKILKDVDGFLDSIYMKPSIPSPRKSKPSSPAPEKELSPERNAKKIFEKVLSPERNANKIEAEKSDETSLMLKSTSEVFILPEMEAKYLDQYRIDSAELKKMAAKVNNLSKKAKLIQEEEMLTPHVIKLQSWYRGVKCRRELLEANLPVFNRSRFYPDLERANRSAIRIQALWRGILTRHKLGPEFTIQILRRVVNNQRLALKEMSEKFSAEILELRLMVKALSTENV